jgi:surface antigen
MPDRDPLTVAFDTLLGPTLTKQIGQGSQVLTKTDVAYYNYASQRAMETMKAGTAAAWKNPDTGVYGTITPLRTYQREDGVYCREYQQDISIGNSLLQGDGVACRNPERVWEYQVQDN